MAPQSRLGRQIAEAIVALDASGSRFALIGGLALASHKVVRATQDVDFLVDADKADEIEARLRELGYVRLHRSADAANYSRGGDRLDFLYAHRGPTAVVWTPSRSADTFASSNASRSWMTCSAKPADPPIVSEGGLTARIPDGGDPYLALDELMVVVEALCPNWPPRDLFVDGGKMRL